MPVDLDLEDADRDVGEDPTGQRVEPFDEASLRAIARGFLVFAGAGEPDV
ncbi:hypothetical protein ACFY2Q_18045 [Micromonospora sp. NPDC000316]